jgi:hypothetical protein
LIVGFSKNELRFTIPFELPPVLFRRIIVVSNKKLRFL